MAENKYAIIRKYAKSEEIVSRFRDIVGDQHANGYIYSVIIAVSSNPDLQECTPTSIMQSAARAATLGLSCDPGPAQAHLVPYNTKRGKEARLIIGWRGLRDLAYRTGKYLLIHTGKVYEGQEWVENQLTGEANIEGSRTSDDVIGYFAFFRRKDRLEKAIYMSIEEINKHKEQYAPGWNRPGSSWISEFEKMAKKTVLRQLLTTWGEMDAIAQIERLESVEEVDEFPEPDQVTIIEEPRRSNEEILKELGIEQAVKKEFEDAEVTIVKEPEPTPARKPRRSPRQTRKPATPPEPAQEEPETPTNYPGSQSEYFTWVAHGNIPHIGVADAKKALTTCNNNYKEAWDLILLLSKERQVEDQPNLI